MECFFWALGMVNEARHSKLREGITKAFYLVTVIDDVYDVYGTLDELELFTNIVERFDLLLLKANLGRTSFFSLYILYIYSFITEL